RRSRLEDDDPGGGRRRMGDAQVNRSDAAAAHQPLGSPAELDRRLPAAFVRDADPAPRYGVPESLARGFLRREESGQPLRPVALAHCILDLALRVDLPREPRQLALVEAIARNLRDVDADSYDHRDDFDACQACHLNDIKPPARQVLRLRAANDALRDGVADTHRTD